MNNQLDKLIKNRRQILGYPLKPGQLEYSMG